ncbi:unnamed protein product [Boreogadus saida]
MFASIWYAKKIGRRLVQNSRRAKMLREKIPCSPNPLPGISPSHQLTSETGRRCVHPSPIFSAVSND